MTKQRPGKALKPRDKCSKHKRSATIWYRDTGELICFKCNTVIIKGVKKTLKKD